MRILSLLTLQSLTAFYVPYGGEYLQLIESRDKPTNDVNYGLSKDEIGLGKKQVHLVYLYNSVSKLKDKDY